MSSIFLFLLNYALILSFIITYVNKFVLGQNDILFYSEQMFTKTDMILLPLRFKTFDHCIPHFFRDIFLAMFIIFFV